MAAAIEDAVKIWTGGQAGLGILIVGVFERWKDAVMLALAVKSKRVRSSMYPERSALHIVLFRQPEQKMKWDRFVWVNESLICKSFCLVQ